MIVLQKLLFLRFAYDDKQVSRSSVIVDDPITASADKNVQIFKDLITEDRHLSCRQLAVETGIILEI